MQLHQVSGSCQAKVSNEIVDRADGVFLWAALVLKSLRGSLKYDNQLEHLLRRIQRMPREMESLIEHLLTWANPLDRISVYRTFAVVEKLAELGMTPMTLRRYSFLSDYEMNTMFAMHAELSGCELIESDMKTRKTQARARLNDQSRGLIELKPLPYRGHLLTKPLDIEHVTFIHRSVFDFLQTHHILDIMEACEGFDIVDAMSQIVLAEIKFFGLYSFHSTRLRWNLLKELPPLLGYCQKEARDASTFRFFDELDHAVLYTQGLSPLQDQQNLLPVYISGTGHFTPSACYFSVFHWAIYTHYV